MADDAQKCEGCDICRPPYSHSEGQQPRCEDCGQFTNHMWFLGDSADPFSWQDYNRCAAGPHPALVSVVESPGSGTDD